MKGCRAARPFVDGLVRKFYGLLSGKVDFERPMIWSSASFCLRISPLHHEDRALASGQISRVWNLAAEEFAQLVHVYITRWACTRLWLTRTLRNLRARGFQKVDARIDQAEFISRLHSRHLLMPRNTRYGLSIHVPRSRNYCTVLSSLRRHAETLRSDAYARDLISRSRPHPVNAHAIS